MDELLKTLALSSCYRTQGGTLTQELERVEEGSGQISDDDVVGKIIDSKFRVDSLIGQGGMGTVYRAHHLTLNKDVALKTFRKAKMSEDAWERFQREAKAIAKVDSLHVVQIFDYGVGADNKPYYTMELLRGESLAARLQRGGPLSLREALPLFMQVCNALTNAHANGIVHRDLKPGNIFLQQVDGRREVVKVVDFGIAKLVGDRMDAQRLTSTGLIFGSPLYMSPEQSLGDDVDGRSDVYSLGCTLFEALTGRPPFVGANAFATITLHQTKKPPQLDGRSGETFPLWLEDLVARMLEKNRDRRISSFEEIKDVIEFNMARDGRYTSNSNSNSNSNSTSTSTSSSSSSSSSRAADPVGKASVDSEAKFSSSRISASLSDQSHTSPDDLKKRFLPSGRVLLSFALLMVLGVGVAALSLNMKSQPAQTPQRAINASNAGMHLQDPLENGETDLIAPFDYGTDIEKFPISKYVDKGWLKLRNEKFDAAKLQKIATSGQHLIDFLKCTFQSADLPILAASAAEKIKICACGLDDSGAEALSLCQGLNYLKANNNKFSSKGVIALTKLKKLVALDVSDSGANDEALRQIVKQLPRLEKLMISNCPDISRDALLNLRGTNVHRLVYMCRTLDDDGLAYIALMPNLTELEIATSNVTADGVRKFCRRSKTIRSINVARCARLSPADLRQLTAEFPSVEIKTTDTSGIDILYDES